MRVLEVLRENNMNSNSAFEILELEFQRESWRDSGSCVPSGVQSLPRISCVT